MIPAEQSSEKCMSHSRGHECRKYPEFQMISAKKERAVKYMGGWYFDKKDTVEDSRSVSIAFLKKHDYFCGYRPGVISWRNGCGAQTASIGVTVCTTGDENYALFQYTPTRRSTGEKTARNYKVQLVPTHCNLGGVRWWFNCL